MRFDWKFASVCAGCGAAVVAGGIPKHDCTRDEMCPLPALHLSHAPDREPMAPMARQTVVVSSVSTSSQALPFIIFHR
jgi:hypothetical protein